MADGEQGEGWWGSWLKVAKEKSKAAYEVVKKDLAEYSCTVHNDTGKAVAKTTTQIKEKLKKPESGSQSSGIVRDSVTSFLESITNVLTIPPDDGDEEPITMSKKTFYDRAQARLNDIQLDSGTYLNEPTKEDQAMYNDWLATFNIESVKGDISELLVNVSQVRALYTKLVPTQVSHADFWQRYYFKVHCLEQEECRRKALKCRAQETVEHEDISWDDDEFESISISGSPAKHTECIGATETVCQLENETCKSTEVDVSGLGDKGTSELVTVEKEASEQPSCNAGSEEVSGCDNTLVEMSTSRSLATGDDIDTPVKVDHRHDTDKDENCEQTEFKTRVMGDTVVVGTERSSPATSSEEDSKKELSSLDDDWEQDFEVTEDDLKVMKEAETLLKTDGKNEEDNDDWENWD